MGWDGVSVWNRRACLIAAPHLRGLRIRLGKQRVSVRQIAADADLDLDEALVLLWDAGFDRIGGPGDRLDRGEANRARRALGIATRRELAAAPYWQTELGLTDTEFADLLASLGVDDPYEGPRLRKKAINRLRAERRRMGTAQATAGNTSRTQSPPDDASPFVWEEVGRRHDLVHLSVDDVARIHLTLVQDFESTKDPIQPAGVKSAHLLASAVHRPTTEICEIPKYPTIEMAAAALLHALVHNHPFHNGNKRTALVAMLVFMDSNGLALVCDEGELFKLVLQLAQHSLVVGPRNELSDRETLSVARWLKANSRWVAKGDRVVAWRQLRRLLTARGCDLEFVSGQGNRVIVSRTVTRKVGLFSRPKQYVLRAPLHIIDDGRELDKGLLKHVRSALQLDDEHGIDTSAFYDGDAISVSEFIVRYRKTLQRLASL